MSSVIVELRVVIGTGSSLRSVVSLANEGEQCVVGSGRDCNLPIQSPGVSGHHIVIRHRGDVVEVEPLDPDARTLLEDKPLVGACAIRGGDIIKIGQATLLVDIKQSAVEPRPSHFAPPKSNPAGPQPESSARALVESPGTAPRSPASPVDQNSAAPFVQSEAPTLIPFEPRLKHASSNASRDEGSAAGVRDGVSERIVAGPPRSAFDPGTSVGVPGTSAAAPLNPARWPAIEGFTILAELGNGGQGRVFKARHLVLDRVVALKELICPFPGALQKLREEAVAMAQVEHDHVVRVYEYIHRKDTAYIVMEYVPNGSGRGALDRLSAAGIISEPRAREPEMIAEALGIGSDSLVEPLSNLRKSADLYFQFVGWWFAGLAEGLQRAHTAPRRSVYHYDIKPGNLLLDVRGRFKLADFGMATVGDLDSKFASSKGGTPNYLAPERLAEWATTQGRAEYRDPRPDVYSLGLTMYEFLAGVPAYCEPTTLDVLRSVATRDPDPPREVNVMGKVPKELEEVCINAIHRDPAKRYQTAEQMHKELRRWIDRTFQGAMKRTGLVGKFF